MLTNINSNKDELLQLVLVGQPELRADGHAPRAAGSSRSASPRTSTCRAWIPDTVEGYIRHRLKVAGGSGDEFTPEALRADRRGQPKVFPDSLTNSRT